ncbi:IclR family transcriptional regulator [Actinoalloteichus hymeniacidonis]|uniref:Glycerol operon regulatory protein n=1 Tax=Actinoalloteichus hymeniacidonis TaxID=340345 RepID=A0AAC9HRF5_9PSEU|nr:IclR family transcriptional regulator [Actinoalloteichus hymeniacidonis]AOS64053.1 transcriptional regulator, IclR family [Actinoalloteichus hymeniacidonis]MBB5907885.1 IclR family acetate operon transcriptional repressor [Actinoalloteichus hymeniacidonis]
MAEETGPGPVQSVVRAFAILEWLAAHGGEAGVSELAEGLDLALPTTHRLMRTLSTMGYVRQLPSRRYALGPGLVGLGDRASALLATWARPTLVELEQTVQETANLAVLDGDMVVYVAQVPSRHQMRMFTEVGRRVFPHSTGVGKALLAGLPDDRVRALLGRTGLPAYTPNTLTTEAEVLAELAGIRERGYAVDEGEQEIGVRCFAIAVPGGDTPTALSVSGPSSRVTAEAESWMVPALKKAAAELAEVLTPGEPSRFVEPRGR